MRATDYFRFSGSDLHCWNLLEKIYHAELGITLENYDDICPGISDAFRDLGSVEEAFDGVRSKWVKVEDPKEFDIIDIRGTKATHVGIYIGNGHMIHKAGKQVKIDNIGGKDWPRRITAFYRHPSMT